MARAGRPAAAQLTSRELLQALRADGQSMTAIASAIGRSPRLLRFVANGEKPGTNLTAALAELYRSGQVRTPPPRRRRSDGQAALIRGRRGQPPVQPPTPAEPATPEPARTTAPTNRQPEFTAPTAPEGRNTYEVDHTDFPGGRTKDTIRAPRRGWNRELGNEAINDVLGRGIAGGQRLQITAWVEIDGSRGQQRIPVLLGGKGGYDPANLAMQIRIDQGDAFATISDQISDDRYAELVFGDWTLIQVEMDLW